MAHDATCNWWIYIYHRQTYSYLNEGIEKVFACLHDDLDYFVDSILFRIHLIHLIHQFELLDNHAYQFMQVGVLIIGLDTWIDSLSNGIRGKNIFWANNK
jgi:hypothetical protein